MARRSFLCMIWLVSLVLLFFTSCKDGRNNGLPASTGQPFEVVLEGDTDSVVTKVLLANVPGLPQEEPRFQVIRIRKGKGGSLYRSIRNRIIVDVDGRNAGYEVRVSKNIEVSPQLVVRIKAQTMEQLKSRLDGEKLCEMLDESELKHLASIIKPNVDKQKKVKRLFGINMKIPFDMQSSKQGKDFLWLSNNANTGMQSLLVFKASNKVAIDSVLKVNMVGETDAMYMQLASVSYNKTLRNSLRGLWEMKGDAMGGPYVMKFVPRGKERLVVMGFVYAPEMKKRNLIKQLEAVLTTIK